MEKIIIDEGLKGKELFKFLRANKSALIAQKKSMEKWSDAISFPTLIFNEKKFESIKSMGNPIPADASTIRVKVVANTSLFIDNDQDLLLRDNASRSINNNKSLILHLKNHGRTLDDQVGDVKNIYYQDIPLTELGFNKPGTAQALIFETDIKRAYDPKTFEKYRLGLIKQHSIGLRYTKLELAINDPEDEKEYDFWNKYYPLIVNPDAADEKGFFWVVPEIKLIENSAVLFGSNQLTPTLNVSSDTQQDPPNGTLADPPGNTKSFDAAELLKDIKFFN